MTTAAIGQSKQDPSPTNPINGLTERLKEISKTVLRILEGFGRGAFDGVLRGAQGGLIATSIPLISFNVVLIGSFNSIMSSLASFGKLALIIIAIASLVGLIIGGCIGVYKAVNYQDDCNYASAFFGPAHYMKSQPPKEPVNQPIQNPDEGAYDMLHSTTASTTRR